MNEYQATLKELQQQEIEIQFTSFTNDTALAVGMALLQEAKKHGNTVVWKPAELVPLTATHLLQALVDAGLPKGVLNMVLGKGSEVGEVLATHQMIDAITFTGSNPVGRSIQREAIEHGKKSLPTV